MECPDLRQQDLRYPELRNAEVLMALGCVATCPNEWMVEMISGFHISGFGVQSPFLVQLPIPDFVIALDQRLMIFLDPMV
jgi:hypothetical protein